MNKRGRGEEEEEEKNERYKSYRIDTTVPIPRANVNQKCLLGIGNSFHKHFVEHHKRMSISLRSFIDANAITNNNTIEKDIKQGWERLERLKSNLEKCTKRRSPMQIQFQQYCTIACIHFLFPESALSSQLPKILSMYRLDELFQLVAARTPRQSGKSEALGAWLASMLEAVPGLRFIVYSNSKRASILLKNKIETNIIAKLEIDPSRIVNNNQEEIKISPVPSNGSMRSAESKKLANEEIISVCKVMPGGNGSENSK